MGDARPCLPYPDNVEVLQRVEYAHTGLRRCGGPCRIHVSSIADESSHPRVTPKRISQVTYLVPLPFHSERTSLKQSPPSARMFPFALLERDHGVDLIRPGRLVKVIATMTGAKLQIPPNAPTIRETYHIPGTSTVLYLTFYPGLPISPSALEKILGQAYRDVETKLESKGDVAIPGRRYDRQYYEPQTGKRVSLRVYAFNEQMTWGVIQEIIGGLGRFTMYADRTRKIKVEVRQAEKQTGFVYVDNGSTPMSGSS
ncbi:MAG: hypothetical protein Q9218_006109 [Villophora microphyllina]